MSESEPNALLPLLVACALAWAGCAHAETFEGGKLEVYISSHADLQAGRYVLEEEIVGFIEGARETLDIAVQEIRWSEDGEWPIAEAILKAARRGVQVRVIVEGDYYDDAHPGNLAFFEQLEREPSVEIMRDDNPAIFHNKFVIRDAAGQDAALLTGSTNFTDTGTRANYNHIVVINFPPVSRSPSYYAMLSRYQAEFDEAWSGVFGDHEPSQEPLRCWIGRTYARAYFAPDNDPDDHLLDLLLGARDSLDVMVFTFGSSSPLMAGVVNRWFTWEHQRTREATARRRLRVATESQQAQYWSAYPPLLAMGVPVRVERNPNAKLHHKVAIIDEARVILGSYNWTLAANNRNDENLLVLSNREVAGLFTAAFDELWDEVLVAP
ncbi:MAG: phospholipase D-like domain-containing protein [Armatimonadota bacterium]